MIADTAGQDEIIQPEHKFNMNWKLIAVAAVVLTLGALVWPRLSLWMSGVTYVPANSVVTATVSRGDLIRDVAVSGKLVAANAPQLYSSESGVVDLLVSPGDKVNAGDVVARIASPELAAELRQQQAKLTSLTLDSQRGKLQDKEAQLDLEGTMDTALVTLNAAKREKARADKSYQQQVMSELEWAKAQDELKEAELNYQHAVKKVAIAKERLQFEQQNREGQVASQQLVLDELNRRLAALDISAPVNGVIGNWLVAQKDKVASSVPLMTVVDLSEYQAELSVPEFYADELGIGLGVTVQLAGKTLKGEIVSISPEINQNQVLLRANIQGIESLPVRQNQRLNARIQFENKRDVLLVKRGAFVQSDNGHTAYRIDHNNIAHKQPIQTGVSSVDYIEVLDGLQEGDQIITSDYSDFLTHDIIQLQN